MSSFRTTSVALSVLSLIGVAGCSSAPASQAADVAAPVEADAETSQGFTREEAARLLPLERANFWAGEHSKDPNDLEAAIEFAKALREIGSHERASEVARTTAVRYPTNAELHLILGRAYSSMNRIQDARTALQQAVFLSPRSADALAALGLVHDKLGEHVSAQTAYRQALTVEPGRAHTRSNLGLSLALTGDLTAAESELRQAVELDGRSTQIRQNLVLVLGLQGRYDEMREAAGDAPESVIEQNIEALRALRGDAAADAAIAATAQSPDLRSTTEG